MSTSSAPISTTPRTSRELHVERRLAGREAGRDRGDRTPEPRRRSTAVGTRFGYTQTAAHDGTTRRPGRGGSPSRRARAPSGRVGALERRQVHRADRELEREHLRVLLDRALRELRRPLLERDLRRSTRSAGSAARAGARIRREAPAPGPRLSVVAVRRLPGARARVCHGGDRPLLPSGRPPRLVARRGCRRSRGGGRRAASRAAGAASARRGRARASTTVVVASSARDRSRIVSCERVAVEAPEPRQPEQPRDDEDARRRGATPAAGRGRAGRAAPSRARAPHAGGVHARRLAAGIASAWQSPP